MECPLCFEIFNDKQKKPRNLDCGHTFCESCLLKIFINNIITCPSCRRASSISPKSLPVNFIAADLARKHTEDRKTFNYCLDHPREVVRFFCNTCLVSICVECIINHCGHQFVKHEESVKLITLKINECDLAISKLTEKNTSAMLEIKELSAVYEKKLQNEYENIEYEFNLLEAELHKRKIRIKEIYKNMIDHEMQRVSENKSKIQTREGVLSREKVRVVESLEVLQTLTDTDSRLKTIHSNLAEIKGNIEELTADALPSMQIPAMIPSFELSKSALEYISNIGKISCTINRDADIIDPTICFFGDKNKVMAYKIIENSWEMRIIDPKYEFNYYAAATTLPDGSAIITGGGSSNSVFLYKDKKLTPALPMNQIRKEHAVVYLNSFVYSLGGYDGANNQFLNECEKFCIYSGEWSNCASMLVARCAFSATSVNNKYIFIFGGYDGSQRLASIERYNPEIDSWCMINTTLRFQLSNCGCFSPHFNRVIVLGGGFSSGFSHAVEMLDIETLEWTSLAYMNEGRDLRNKLTYYNGGAYCVGGYNFRAEVFLVESEVWTQLSNYLVSDNLDSWSSSLTYRVH